MAHHEDQTVNLENFAGTNKAINSPRSLEACLRQGVDPAQLVPQELVLKKGELEDVAKFEHEHYDKRRLGTLRHCFRCRVSPAAATPVTSQLPLLKPFLRVRRPSSQRVSTSPSLSLTSRATCCSC